MRSAKFTDAAALAICLAVCLAAEVAGGLLTADGVGEWYHSLRRPAWAPPDWLFGPVWTILYLSMAVAVWLAWRNSAGGVRRRHLWLFAAQLALNVAWSGLFFWLRSPGLALLEIVVLWCAIAATLISFARSSRWAAILMAPYLGWVSFATALNWGFWRLN